MRPHHAFCIWKRHGPAPDERDNAKRIICIFTTTAVNKNNGALLFAAKSNYRFKCWYNDFQNIKSVNGCSANEVFTVYTNMADCVNA
jgi:hypothetical protein